MQNKIGKYRWTICGLLFFATTVNYLDRAVMSYLKDDLTTAFGWSKVQGESNYADIETWFKLAYAFGMVFAGSIVDKLGTKIGYAAATFFWSLAAVLHAFTSGITSFSIARVFLGITEAGNFPAAIKTTAEWFPQKERALATGIFNSGANIGAIVAPLTVPFIAANWGWQWAFIITGSLGFIWLILWFMYYEVPAKQARLGAAEYAYIQEDVVVETPISAENTKNKKTSISKAWSKLLSFKQTWAFALGKLLTDPIWWFYLFWLPDFLKKQYHLSSLDIIMPSAIVYTIASFGSIFGGWLPMKLINGGWSAFNARRTSMLVYALCVFPIVFAQYLGSINMWYAVIVIGIAAAAHQAWSANIFTTVSDMFPKKATASVTGIGGMFGGLGGIMLSQLVQKKLFVYYTEIGQIETAYYIMFGICGTAYLVAWFVMRLLVPKFEKVIV